MLWTLLYLFCAGLAIDWLVTWHYRFVSAGRRWPAAGSNLVVLLTTLLAFRRLVGEDSGVVEIVAYSLGAALGCLLAFGRPRK